MDPTRALIQPYDIIKVAYEDKYIVINSEYLAIGVTHEASAKTGHWITTLELKPYVR